MVLDWAVVDVPAVRVSDDSCGCDTSIRITETKQTLKLETIRVHDRHSHIGGKMHACKSAPGVGGLQVRSWSWPSASDESGR
jgi:hypothetical protein